MNTETSSPGIMKERPRGLLRLFFKFPVLLHRLGLGGWERLIGVQWMFITTTGRKSGKPRHAMVDVMRYDQAADTYYVEAAYGPRADWYRNLQANPVFHAQVGRRQFEARATTLSPEATADMVVQFFRRRPTYTRTVMAFVGLRFKDEAELRQMAGGWMLLAIKPQV